jgi:hypothetical protein
MMFGLDVLGMAAYSDLVVREWVPGMACGVFANTFGNVWPGLEKLLATGKCPSVRIQAIWDDAHKYSPKKHDPIIKKELQRANALKAKFPSVRVQLSPFCEHNIKGQQLKDLLNRCGNEAKDVEIVNCPWQGDLSDRFMNEIHGSHTVPAPKFGAYQYSYDGTNCVDANVEADKAKHKDAQIFFFWHPRFNLKWSMKDTTPRPQRKAKPDANLFDSVVFLKSDKGATSLPKKGWLLKSHAERHEQLDYKGDKLLIIAPVKADQIELKGKGGKLLDVLKYYGPFDGGGHRYYSKTYGYLVAEKAMLLAGGSPLCELFVGKKKYGTVNPGFRDSTYR